MFNNMCFFLYGLLVLKILKTLMVMLPLMLRSLSLKEGSLSLKSMFLQAVVPRQKSIMTRLRERLNVRVLLSCQQDMETNEVNAASTPVAVVGQISTNSTNTFSVAGPFNTGVSSTFEKSSFVDTSQYPDDPNMPALEDITYSDDEEDVGAEADFTNLETNITEELLQFKRQKVWLLVDLPNGKRDIGFEDPDYPNKVYKVVKALYVLHQAPRACKAEARGIFISQDKYIAKILRMFGLTARKSVSTPIDTEKLLLKDPDGKDVDVHTYRSMIGSLMYLTLSRPEIMFAVYACARFQVTPKALHLHTVKRMFRYLKGKPHLGLWYHKDSPFNLVAYSDSDYAGASLDRKSTTWGCQFLGCRLISWQSKKQIVVATSAIEAKYVVAARQATTGKENSNPFMAGSLPKAMKKVIITEATVREDVRLDDAEMAQQADDVADEVVDGVDVDDVPIGLAEPTLPSPTPTIQPPPPSQELPSTSHIIPTPPLSPIAKSSSPP
nr:uncharacterized mitochondrial protein AtMg00810-like [Tanacetum cinerariifolium]